MSTTANTTMRPASAATTRKMINPNALRTVVVAVRGGILRRSGAYGSCRLISHKHICSGRCTPQPIARPSQAGVEQTHK